MDPREITSEDPLERDPHLEEIYSSLCLDVEPATTTQRPWAPPPQEYYLPRRQGIFSNMGIPDLPLFDQILLYSNWDGIGFTEHPAAPCTVARSNVARDAAVAYASNGGITSNGFHQYPDVFCSGLAQPPPSSYGLSAPLCTFQQNARMQFGDLYLTATNATTSEVLCCRIRRMGRAQIGQLFLEFKENIEEMMNHPIASSVSAILIEVFSVSQIDQILRKLCSRGSTLCRLCLNHHGSKVVRKLMERVRETDQKTTLTRVLKTHLLQLVRNDEGRCVVNFCLTNFSDDENKFLLEEIGRKCHIIGKDKKGYELLTRIITSYQGRNNETYLLGEAVGHSMDLASDEYGNFVVQAMLNLENMDIKQGIFDRLVGHFNRLSRNKFGSHVTETCLRQAPRMGQLGRIVGELLHHEPFSSLFLDNYGNYVMQTALRVSMDSNSPTHQLLLVHLRENEAMLRCTSFGKQLLKWLRPLRIRIANGSSTSYFH
ncbi:hypothetical protein SAY86_016074 [Trapa natans]|uniref:PUM-HD domain-containing protein n=1 Tax=Trapa natans TaxID=22666 RepID=A0AAN7LKS5_TRANT|nr:hypothetical protein SAY86_016074 [Trapa natans]